MENLDSNYIHIKRILDIIEEWNHEYYLPNKRSPQYKPIVNGNELIRWSHKKPDRVEFIIKNYSQEFKKLIIKELNKDNCVVKFFPMSNGDCRLIVKMKSTCIIL